MYHYYDIYTGADPVLRDKLIQNYANDSTFLKGQVNFIKEKKTNGVYVPKTGEEVCKEFDPNSSCIWSLDVSVDGGTNDHVMWCWPILLEGRDTKVNSWMDDVVYCIR